MNTKQQVSGFIKYYLQHYKDVELGYATQEIFNIDRTLDSFKINNTNSSLLEPLKNGWILKSFIESQKIKVKHYALKNNTDTDSIAYCGHNFDANGQYQSSRINTPDIKFFRKSEYYYYVLFHEFCHYAILKTHIKENKNFDYYHYIYLAAKPKYKINEEIVCNLASSIMCKKFGITIPKKILVSQFKYYSRFLNDINVEFLVNSIDLCLEFFTLE